MKFNTVRITRTRKHTSAHAIDTLANIYSINKVSKSVPSLIYSVCTYALHHCIFTCFQFAGTHFTIYSPETMLNFPQFCIWFYYIMVLIVCDGIHQISVSLARAFHIPIALTPFMCKVHANVNKKWRPQSTSAVIGYVTDFYHKLCVHSSKPLFLYK